MSVDIEIVSDPLAELARMLERALAADGPVVLTGGSTAQAYAQVEQTAWAGAELWFSDERGVAPSDENSNYGQIKTTLFNPLALAGVQLGAVHRVLGEEALDEAADDYQNQLEMLANTQGGTLSWELVVLGLGPDGHIASMFPGQESLDEQERLSLAVPVAGLDPKVPRITLTFPALAGARHLVLVAAGEGKADALAHAFSDDAPASRDWPASLLSEWVQDITVLTDSAGAARL